MVDLCTPENEPEAQAIQQMLQDPGIECEVVRLQSSVYPGLFHPQWGVIRVSPDQLLRAQELVEEWRAARVDTGR